MTENLLQIRSILPLFVLAFLLTGCAGGSSSAEQAAAKYVINMVSDEAVIDPRSIEILQAQPFEDSTYVVLSYRRKYAGNDETCLVLYETHRELFRGWVSTGGGGACATQEDESAADVLRFSGGTSFRREQNKPPVSHALGKVSDPAIVKVDITWEDGQVQQAQVVNNSVLAMRTGEAQVRNAVGLDQEDEVIFTFNR